MPADIRDLLATGATVQPPEVDVEELITRGRRRRRSRLSARAALAVAVIGMVGVILRPGPEPAIVDLVDGPAPTWPVQVTYELSRVDPASSEPVSVLVREFTGSGWDDWIDRGIDPASGAESASTPSSPGPLFNARWGEPLPAEEGLEITGAPELAEQVAAALGLDQADVAAERVTRDDRLVSAHAWLPALGLPLFVDHWDTYGGRLRMTVTAVEFVDEQALVADWGRGPRGRCDSPSAS